MKIGREVKKITHVLGMPWPIIATSVKISCTHHFVIITLRAVTYNSWAPRTLELNPHEYLFHWEAGSPGMTN